MLEAHEAAWTVLSRLLRVIPAAETVDRVRDPELLATWPLRHDNPATDRGLELLERSRERSETGDAVARDYRRVFHGPGPVPAPPYESVHLGVDGLLFDTDTLQVRAFYRRFGLQVPRLNRDPDDHVALELELLATLAGRALDALDSVGSSGREHGYGAAAGTVDELLAAIGSFLDEHVLAWVPRFGELVSEHARTDFVTALGHLLVGTLDCSAGAFATPPPRAAR